MIDVRRGEDRCSGGEPGAGIETRHAFSFGGHYDPDNVRFGLLLACNEERLAPGAGFAEHAHRDTEIVTWVVEGELEHRDGGGRAARLRAGDAQRLSAGGGVRHVERNRGAGVVRFLQMWLHPEVFGGTPEYTVAAAPAPAGPGLTLLASGAPGASPPLRLRQSAAALYVGRP
ncbi:pirin family protein, partial [Streptomyces sp.]|uniref:pirin family protein n=1 Tax=Streptomyces sp. TaxID=1931 RepID=UPI002F4177B0